jgi:adenylylsulfate kinase
MTNSNFVLWLTGLPASGKTTIAQALGHVLKTEGRDVVLLDGDDYRKQNPDLGYTKSDRDINVLRAGNEAHDYLQEGKSVICAFVSPYRETREKNRKMLINYVEVYVNAPIELCIARDPKGLYREYGDGMINGVTGLDDPYEPPTGDYIECCTNNMNLAECISHIVKELKKRNLL